MTEFEIATVAFQEATIAFQEATLAYRADSLVYQADSLAYQADSLALRESALWVAVAQVAVSLAIGIAQVAVVWYGIRAMQRVGAQRAHEQDQRHTEAMRALDALIDGQRRQGEALSALIERTAN